jgi:hypothetical protein
MTNRAAIAHDVKRRIDNALGLLERIGQTKIITEPRSTYLDVVLSVDELRTALRVMHGSPDFFGAAGGLQ